jgi:hypothetical protein
MADFKIKSAAGTGNKLLIKGQNQDVTDSSYAIEIGDGGALKVGTISEGTIENAPAGITTKVFGFSAYLSGAMTINNGTWTEVNATWTERWDTDGKFDTSTGRFTPTIQGIYLCGYSSEIDEIDDGEIFIGNMRKNGTSTDGTDMYGYSLHHASKTDGTETVNASSLVQLDTNDYVSFWAYQNSGGNDPLNINKTEFWAVYQGQV